MEEALQAALADIARLNTELDKIRSELAKVGVFSGTPQKPFRQDAIMDSKAFSRLNTFKGGSSGVWLKWFKKFEALIIRTHPHKHVQIRLNNVRHGMPKEMFNRDKYYEQMKEESDRVMFTRVDPDIHEALHFC